jgi:hypothetical protein
MEFFSDVLTEETPLIVYFIIFLGIVIMAGRRKISIGNKMIEQPYLFYYGLNLFLHGIVFYFSPFTIKNYFLILISLLLVMMILLIKAKKRPFSEKEIEGHKKASKWVKAYLLFSFLFLLFILLILLLIYLNII